MRRVGNEEGIEIEGEHGIRMNPVWIDDVACGLRLLVERDIGGIVHLAGPETVTIRELVEFAGELLGVTLRLVQKPGLGIERHVGAYDRACSLGYAPKTTLRDGIRRLIDQMRLIFDSLKNEILCFQVLTDADLVWCHVCRPRWGAGAGRQAGRTAAGIATPVA